MPSAASRGFLKRAGFMTGRRLWSQNFPPRAFSSQASGLFFSMKTATPLPAAAEQVRTSRA